MAVTVASLAIHLRLQTDPVAAVPEPTNTVLTGLLAWASADAARRAPMADESSLDQAIIAMCGYVYDAPPSRRGEGYANAWRSSGAAEMLRPWVRRRAVVLGVVDAPGEGGGAAPSGGGAAPSGATADVIVEQIGDTNPTLALTGDQVWHGSGIFIPASVDLLMLTTNVPLLMTEATSRIVWWAAVRRQPAGVVGEAYADDSITSIYRIGHDAAGQLLLGSSAQAASIVFVRADRLLTATARGGAGGLTRSEIQRLIDASLGDDPTGGILIGAVQVWARAGNSAAIPADKLALAVDSLARSSAANALMAGETALAASKAAAGAAGDAAGVADAAAGAADTAKAAADAAQTAADGAQTAADGAQTAADGAKTAADTKLTQTETDARVVAGVLPWSLTDNLDLVPQDKLPAPDDEVVARGLESLTAQSRLQAKAIIGLPAFTRNDNNDSTSNAKATRDTLGVFTPLIADTVFGTRTALALAAPVANQTRWVLLRRRVSDVAANPDDLYFARSIRPGETKEFDFNHLLTADASHAIYGAEIDADYTFLTVGVYRRRVSVSDTVAAVSWARAGNTELIPSAKLPVGGSTPIVGADALFTVTSTTSVAPGANWTARSIKIIEWTVQSAPPALGIWLKTIKTGKVATWVLIPFGSRVTGNRAQTSDGTGFSSVAPGYSVTGWRLTFGTFHGDAFTVEGYYAQ